MLKSTQNLFLIVALLGGTIGFASCSSSSTGNSSNTAGTTNKNAAVVTSDNSSKTTTETTKTETVSTTGDKIGVPECDEYVEKYEACISKVPEAQRRMLKTNFEQQRESFRKAASTAQGKATLSAQCKQAINLAKQSTVALGCAW